MEYYYLLNNIEIDDHVLFKVFVFVLVQGLVFLILYQSSDVFSPKTPGRSFSFKMPRSISIRRMAAALADIPAAAAGGDEQQAMASPKGNNYSFWG